MRLFLVGKVEMTCSTSASGLALASVIDTNRRPEQRLCASPGKTFARPAVSKAVKVCLQFALALHVEARVLTTPIATSSLTPLKLRAPMTEPPELPAIFVLLSMMPKFRSTAVTPTKYMTCSNSRCT